MIAESLLLLLGLFLLWKASDFTVDAVKKIAEKYDISHAVIGLTVVAIGTSLPEIFTNVYSGIQVANGIDASGLAIGSTVGSQISQITLIIGITAIVGTMHVRRGTLRREGSMLIIALAGMTLAGLDGRIEPIEGLLLCIGYLVYLAYVIYRHKVIGGIRKELKAKKKKEINALVQMGIIGLGILALILGGKLVVDNALSIAQEAGVSQTLIGIFIVGLGSSLPELSVAIAGIRKRAEGISLGSLIGSNITDPMLSLGAGAAIAGFTFDSTFLYFDIPFWLVATCITLALMQRNCKIGKEDRKEGAVLIAMFIIYVVLKITIFSG